MESAGPVSSSKWQEVRQNLKLWRESGVRNSLKTVEGGCLLLQKKKYALGNEGALLVIE